MTVKASWHVKFIAYITLGGSEAVERLELWATPGAIQDVERMAKAIVGARNAARGPHATLSGEAFALFGVEQAPRRGTIG